MQHYYTDNPVRDAEMYAADLEELESKRPYEICSTCGSKIHLSDENYESDVGYRIEDDIYCEDCITSYLKEHRVV